MLEELMPVMIDETAEFAVLGCLLAEPACVDEVLEMLCEDDFTDVIHKRVFREVAELTRSRKPVDPVTVHQSLRSGGASDITFDVLLGYADCVPSRSNARYYAGIVRELSRRRRIFRKIQEWLRRFGELKADGLIDEMERLAAAARDDAADDVTVSSFDAVESSLPEVTWLWEGWLPRGFLTVLASSPGEGKSGLALEIARRVLAGGAWPDGASVGCSVAALGCDGLCSVAALGCAEKEKTAPEGGCATQEEKATPEGGCATQKEKTAPEGGCATQEEKATPEGGCATQKEKTAPEGGCATQEEKATPEGGCATQKEKAAPEGGCATQEEKATPEGGCATSARTALYVDTEAAGAILRGRVRAWGIPTEGLNVFAATDPAPGLAELSLDDPRDWRRLERGVVELAPSLVVVDSLSGAHGRDENSSEMRVLLLKLARLARDSQAAFLVVHHLRKKSALEPDAVTLDRLRGSGTIAQFARCVWAVDRPDATDPRRRLVQIKNNLAAFPEPIGFTVTGEGIRFGDAPSEPHVETQAEKAAEFLRTILRERPLPATEVFRQAEENGLSRTLLHRAGALLKIRKIKTSREGYWLWSLPASAQAEQVQEAGRPRS